MSFPSCSRILRCWQASFRDEKIAEIEECFQRRFATILHVELDEVPDIHPLYQCHQLVARRDLPVGALICETDLSAFARGSAYLFHHSPNVARVWPFVNNVTPHWRGHYSWSALDLLSYRVEGLIFPSALLAAKTHRWRIPSHWYPSPNIVLHFLGNGLSCGEPIQDVSAGEALVRHFSLGPFSWSSPGDTRGWITKSADKHARMLLEELDDCDEYFAECASHDENESRADRALWYREDTFVRAAALYADPDVDWREMVKQTKELSRMHACDVNVLPPP